MVLAAADYIAITGIVITSVTGILGYIRNLRKADMHEKLRDQKEAETSRRTYNEKLEAHFEVINAKLDEEKEALISHKTDDAERFAGFQNTLTEVSVTLKAINGSVGRHETDLRDLKIRELARAEDKKNASN